MALSIEAKEADHYFNGIGHQAGEEAPKEWGINFEQAIDNKEFSLILETCKKRLKEIQQAVFVLKYMEDIDAVKICFTLKTSAANYLIIINRTKLQQRNCLKKKLD